MNILSLNGPPGSGKTTFANHLHKYVFDQKSIILNLSDIAKLTLREKVLDNCSEDNIDFITSCFDNKEFYEKNKDKEFNYTCNNLLNKKIITTEKTTFRKAFISYSEHFRQEILNNIIKTLDFFLRLEEAENRDLHLIISDLGYEDEVLKILEFTTENTVFFYNLEFSYAWNNIKLSRGDTRKSLSEIIANTGKPMMCLYGHPTLENLLLLQNYQAGRSQFDQKKYFIKPNNITPFLIKDYFLFSESFKTFIVNKVPFSEEKVETIIETIIPQFIKEYDYRISNS